MSLELLGQRVDTYSFKEALNKARALIDSNKVSQVVTINPEMFDTAEKDPEFAKILADAEMVIPDGIGVKIALKIHGYNVERIPGIDFTRQLLVDTAKCEIPIAIIGAKSEVIEKAVENLQQEIPNINIVYYHDGYFKDENEIYNELKIKSPKLILVALGSPKQEKFIYKAKSVLNPALMIGIGGSLDVWSGNIKRAPKFIQKTGMEWLYRTILQPSRLKRIFPTLPMFLIKVLSYKNKL